MASTAAKKKAEKTLGQLIDDLKNSPSEKVRYNAARMLGEMDDPDAVEPLIDALINDKNGSVRLYAARALGELGDARATQPLIDALVNDRNIDVRVRAARALGKLGSEEVVLPLVEALSDTNSQVCVTAADALVEIGPVAVKPLIRSLDSEKVNVRCDAARALGELKCPEAVGALVELLSDEWVNVRLYAVQSLEKLGDKRAVPALIQAMQSAEENDLVRAGSASALGAIKDPRALIPLRELIMAAQELGEIEDTALKSYKLIMAANWKTVPGANYKKASTK
ncbi:MAG: HEAT repeat domain-containing protein [Cyanobacteria bacterium HKST-UBA06]|nr:HEAT repeat domain-containing protein [Cyanobacteria bacterium HKST-UBA04]MCA9806852.1 HEAT repeat domain-containing protein [Cyanobacteria bacterium HKST-UBA06]MCA9841025.1 HEAT repeat domain-containing protein [Cyanobacteria bacterium HKST-UBA03]